MDDLTKNFIEKSRKVHGDKYDYSKVEYKGSHKKVCIICPEHGEFWQDPSNHLAGQNCPKCSHRSTKKTTEEFVYEARKVHGDKYDYSKVDYINSHEKICIICPEHGEFWQTPNDHLCGHGCRKCYDEKDKKYKKTTEIFVEELKSIYGDLYDYSKVKYVSSKKKICLICKKHGEFFITPNSLLTRKNGCPKCSKETLSKKNTCTTESFVEKARNVHGNYYDYSLVNYTGAKNDVTIICPKHGAFCQKPNYHLSGNGCPKCKISKLELSVLTELDKTNIEYLFHYRPKFLKGLEFDFYFPEIKTAIECQGRQHYKAINFFGGIEGLKKTVERDIMKKNICENKGISLLYYTNENITDDITFTDVNTIIAKIKKLYYERYLP